MDEQNLIYQLLQNNISILEYVTNRLRLRNKAQAQNVAQDIQNLAQEAGGMTPEVLEFFTDYYEKNPDQFTPEAYSQRRTQNAIQRAIPDMGVKRSGQAGDFQYGFDVVGKGKAKPGQSVNIINAMFDRPARVTQEFGRYNPQLEPRSGINYGTDFAIDGSTGHPMKNPFNADLEVLSVVDGYGQGGIGRFDQNQGYGNQVVVRRSDTGEILKLNHLQSGIPYKAGDKIQPGQQIAKLGASGNVTGPHLDIEAFDPSGRVKDIADIQPDPKTNFAPEVLDYPEASSLEGHGSVQKMVNEAKPQNDMAELSADTSPRQAVKNSLERGGITDGRSVYYALGAINGPPSPNLRKTRGALINAIRKEQPTRLEQPRAQVLKTSLDDLKKMDMATPEAGSSARLRTPAPKPQQNQAQQIAERMRQQAQEQQRKLQDQQRLQQEQQKKRQSGIFGSITRGIRGLFGQGGGYESAMRRDY